MHPPQRKLEGGDRCSIGRSSEIVPEVVANPRPFGALFAQYIRTAALPFVALTAILLVAGMPAHSLEPFGENAPGLPALLYVSDYFSFVGEDEHGHVAFALDNNRGRDGDAYQAEHFVVLHDEHRGWIDLHGSGSYENSRHELMKIPDSDTFQFVGAPHDGITILSPANHLTLRIDAIPPSLQRAVGSSQFWMGSAPAVLEYAGRTLKGRVIYEYLYKPDFNRLTRTYWGLWKDFQGFYLSIGGEGDFYLHSQQSEKLGALVGRLIGFSVFGGRVHQVDNIELDVRSRALTLGFYRWPTSWNIRWSGQEGPGSMAFTLSDRKVLGNWVLGGFAMGIVQGEIEYGGQRRPFYGLAELLM